MDILTSWWLVSLIMYCFLTVHFYQLKFQCWWTFHCKENLLTCTWNVEDVIFKRMDPLYISELINRLPLWIFLVLFFPVITKKTTAITTLQTRPRRSLKISPLIVSQPTWFWVLTFIRYFMYLLSLGHYKLGQITSCLHPQTRGGNYSWSLLRPLGKCLSSEKSMRPWVLLPWQYANCLCITWISPTLLKEVSTQLAGFYRPSFPMGGSQGPCIMVVSYCMTKVLGPPHLILLLWQWHLQ